MRIQDPPREPRLPVHVVSKTPFTYFEALLGALDPQGTRCEFRYSALQLDGCRYYFAWRFWAVWRQLQKLRNFILLLLMGCCILLFVSGCSFLLLGPGSFIVLFGWWHWLSDYRGSCSPASRCLRCRVRQNLSRHLGISNRMPSRCRTSAVYILYHTVTSGRLNLTDVADSLYDDYLKYLEARAGCKNVIIFIDDVLNPEAAKQSIQNHQPTAVKCSGMICCFKSKKEQDSERWNAQEINAINGYLQHFP